MEIKIQTPRDPLVERCWLPTPHFLASEPVFLRVVMCPANKPHILASIAGRSGWLMSRSHWWVLLGKLRKGAILLSPPCLHSPCSGHRSSDYRALATTLWQYSNPNIGSQLPKTAQQKYRKPQYLKTCPTSLGPPNNILPLCAGKIYVTLCKSLLL